MVAQTSLSQYLRARRVRSESLNRHERHHPISGQPGRALVRVKQHASSVLDPRGP